MQTLTAAVPGVAPGVAKAPESLVKRYLLILLMGATYWSWRGYV